MIDKNLRLHFVGAGGIGMSAIAQILCELGYSVTGSDAKASGQLELISRKGGRIFVGHRTEQVGDADIVIRSSAIHEENPEIIEARRRNLPIWQRAQMLSEILSLGKAVTISGAHGKTTTTSMVALVFERCGLDPTAIIGGELNDLGGNAKLGHGNWVVAEADESDGSFLYLHPDISIVTNVDADHLDYYRDLDHIEATFVKFLEGMRPGGLRVMGFDSPAARRVAERTSGRLVTFALNQKADYTAGDVRKDLQETTFTAIRRGEPLGTVKLQVPGRHNIGNALAALAAAEEAGIPFEAASAALYGFRGVRRRFELKGVANDVRVFDDYAHHPAEIQATVSALQERAPGRKIGVFQPHRYSRTMALRDGFAESFSGLDMLILTDVYSAGEAPIKGVNGTTLFEAVKPNRNNVHYLKTLDEVGEFLLGTLQPGDTLITMGAGDVWRGGERIVHTLGK